MELSWRGVRKNMIISRKVGYAAVAATILLALGLVFVLVSETILPFTDHLRQDALAGDNEQTVSFFQGDEEDKVASVFVRHGPTGENLYRMMVEIWHREKTVLDSLSLKFNTVRPASALWMETPEGYPWPPMEYRSTIDPGGNDSDGGVIVNIPDLEFQGVGTVRLVFYLRTDVMIPAPPEELALDVAFSMHGDGLAKLTKQEGGATILIELASGPTSGVAFEKLFSDPGQYSGTDILLDGFYFHGWETIVLSERLEPSGLADGHLWPQGRMTWIEDNLMPTEVYDQLYQQDMIGPLERYGMLRIRGRFEHGGIYGHGGGFTAQIISSEVELLPWSPASLQTGLSPSSLKYHLIEHFGGVLVGEPVVVPDDVRREQARSAFPTIQQNDEEFQAVLDQLGLERRSELTEEEQVQVLGEKEKLNAVLLEPAESGHSFWMTIMEEGDPFEIEGTLGSDGEVSVLKKEHALLPR